MAQAYANTAERLAHRILALIPGNQKILTMDGPWGLFDIAGFKCKDIAPSLAQAGWALARAREMHKSGVRA